MDQIKSKIVKKYRNDNFKSGDSWLAGKRLDDNAEGLWRIHNKLYDLTHFIPEHPGGREWLQMTEGTDITEAFESHHIRDVAENLLPKFYVRDAALPRNYNYTYHSDGFYKTLKRRVANKLPVENQEEIIAKSKFYSDFVLVLTILSFALAARQFNIFTALFSAAMIVLCTLCAHNFLHQRDNWRMYLMNLSIQSYKDWRSFHILSHHLYTNTVIDLDTIIYDPYFSFLPFKKNFVQRYLSWIYGPLIYTIFITCNMFRIVPLLMDYKKLTWDDFLPYSVPIFMYLFGDVGISQAVIRWFSITVLSSFLHGLIQVSGGAGDHHSNRTVHDGDAVKSLDFGLYQIAATFERAEGRNNQFINLITFGQHAAHHLFPTLDHGLLPELNEIIEDTCKEFGGKIHVHPRFDLFVWQHQQLARTEPYSTPYDG